MRNKNSVSSRGRKHTNAEYLERVQRGDYDTNPRMKRYVAETLHQKHPE